MYTITYLSVFIYSSQRSNPVCEFPAPTNYSPPHVIVNQVFVRGGDKISHIAWRFSCRLDTTKEFLEFSCLFSLQIRYIVPKWGGLAR